MAQIPKAVLDRSTFLSGLPIIGRGKVRDSYGLIRFPELMLVVASNRVSIYDFVLNALIPQKGEVLNALNLFWRRIFQTQIQHDLVAFGPAIDQYLPQELRGNVELWKTAVVVRKLKMIPIEGIVRGCLTGSAFNQYESQPDAHPRIVYGHEMPEGLIDGSFLQTPLFTPTTKADVGHDEEISVSIVRSTYGIVFEEKCIQLYKLACQHAAGLGIIIADTKFEGDAEGRIGDEWLTPDSSRFWARKTYDESMSVGKLPPSLDKQFVREWGKNSGIDKCDPESPGDVAYVHSLYVPEEVITMTRDIYRDVFQRLTGSSLEDYQNEYMQTNLGKSQK